MGRAAAVAGTIATILLIAVWAVTALDRPDLERSSVESAQPPPTSIEAAAPPTTTTVVDSVLARSTLQTSTTSQQSGTTQQAVTAPLVSEPARLENAAGLPAVAKRPSPVGLTIGSLAVQSAEVHSAGVLASGEMEVPAPTEVGWYRYGPTPGAEGSAVLAAHIAASGVDGVFRNLDTIEIGAEVIVLFDDGSTSSWRVTERAQYDKDSLPVNDLFARSGPPRLTMVTCGGAFNPSVHSYEDNVIVTAVPA